MNQFIFKYEKANIKSNGFNLSGKSSKKKIYYHWCSKYLTYGQILLRGQSANLTLRKAILNVYDMRNGNLISKKIYKNMKCMILYTFQNNLLTLRSSGNCQWFLYLLHSRIYPKQQVIPLYIWYLLFSSNLDVPNDWVSIYK